MITRAMYMTNSKELFQEYYLQFATELTKQQVLEEVGIDALLASTDTALNDVKIPFNAMSSGGGWWWDTVHINTSLLREAGESNSPCTHTCVGKAIARQLIKAHYLEVHNVHTI